MVFSLYELGWRDWAKVWAIWVWRNLVFWEECEVWDDLVSGILAIALMEGSRWAVSVCGWNRLYAADTNGSVNWPVSQVLVT